ncbi:MAG: histidine kinase, partial [Bacteroidota bacterium]
MAFLRLEGDEGRQSLVSDTLDPLFEELSFYNIHSVNGMDYLDTSPKDYLVRHDGSLNYANSGGLLLGREVIQKDTGETFLRMGYTYALEYGKGGILYSGHPDGLVAFTASNPFESDSFPEMRGKFINELAVDADSVLWIGTMADGAYAYFEGEFLEFPELKGRSIHEIEMDEERGEVWMATDLGAWCIRVESYSPFRYGIQTIQKRDGILAKSVNCVAIKDSLIYLGTNMGLSMVRRSLLEQPPVQIPMHIRSVAVEGQAVPLASEYRLAHDENDIVIGFIGLSYADRGTQTYAYRMHGVDPEWRKTKELQAAYPQLAPGDDRFEVKMLYAGELEASETISIDFHVAAFWAETWWFRVSAGLSIILSIVFVLRWRFVAARNRERKAHQVERKLSELEGRALQAQMNPHFIFNALNSVNSFISKNDERSANKFLTDFSRLMRMVLESSQEDLIT